MWTNFIVLFSLLTVSIAGLNADIATKPKRKLKILVTSASFGWSHLQFQGGLANILTEAGHEVHILNYNMSTVVGNYTGATKGQKIHGFVSKLSHDNIGFTYAFNGLRNFILDGSQLSFFSVFTKHCKELLADDAFIHQLKAEKFDVILAEKLNFCSFGIGHALGIRTKLGTSALPMGSFLGYDFGVPFFSSFNFHYYTYSENVINDTPTFLDRLLNFLTLTAEFWTDVTSEHTAMFRHKFGKDFPSIKDILRNISLIFVNSNTFASHPHALSHKNIFIGGIFNSVKPKPLNPKMKALLDASKNGAVLCTFGTLADPSHMDEPLRNAFIRAFQQFPNTNFIWKFEVADNQTLPSNVHAFKWVEQRAILDHPNLKIFITHAGLNSINEAGQAGIPIISFPLLFDQAHNAAIFVRINAGIALDITKMRHNENHLSDALRKMLPNDNQYIRNAKILKQKFDNAPFLPKEVFVRWVEFASQFNNLNELNFKTVHELGTIVYYNIDVLFAIVIALLVVFCLILIIGRQILKIISGTSISPKKKIN